MFPLVLAGLAIGLVAALSRHPANNTGGVTVGTPPPDSAYQIYTVHISDSASGQASEYTQNQTLDEIKATADLEVYKRPTKKAQVYDSHGSMVYTAVGTP